ncbi:hypothetical protein [Candidatus Mycobacterium methanotrophicum]|uniref:Mammalian cell entry protein n=1 Tax=Candidatus Mycobacterium methanotrophicum TaxID=2943498 RepID=A0ABY4QKM4_9MYCO|nr:hypothetical protein [Candidatus Mycobacterium methanotrophicum]UQX10868.1 hypothetical protein M5I08_23465 [Candidatus Mycobacterium methanotrophicum]
MPEQTKPVAEPADEAAPEQYPDGFEGPFISGYGVASAALGALSVAAIALAAVIWLAHRSDVAERSYQSQAMRAAVDWTGVLINMNASNVAASLQRLHDGTVGELNADFDSAMQPYQQVVQRLHSTSHGQVEAVALEAVRHDLDSQPGAPRPAPAEQLPTSVASRTDTVIVVATSVSENAGGKPQTVHWNLRLAVSDVDGKPMISRLESVR